MANLAEDVARAIGANPLLVRAGPSIMTLERLLSQSTSPKTSPTASILMIWKEPDDGTGLIISHIEKGLELARKREITGADN
ncbi:MAG: hypothetical protein R2744_02280 [Bacteroidales bacterium]